ALIEMFGRAHSVDNRADQEQRFNRLRVHKSKIDSQSAAGGITDDHGALHVCVGHDLAQVIGRRKFRFWCVGAAVTAAIVANNVEVLAELRPGFIPGDSVEKSIVQEDDVGAAAALFVIDFRTSEFEVALFLVFICSGKLGGERREESDGGGQERRK